MRCSQRLTMRKRTLAFFLLLAGCPMEPQVGSLGNGKFGYRCAAGALVDASNFDAACAPGFLTGPTVLPSSVAVGSTFTVTYRSNKSTNDETVFSAGPSLVALTGGHFEAQRAGVVALIGTRGNAADDFVYVRTAKVASIKIAQASSRELVATPVDSDGKTLGGRLACTWTWTSWDPEVTFSSSGRKASVAGPAGRSATINAQCGDVHGTILVTVPGSQDAGADAPADAPVDAPNDASDGGSDA